MQYQAPADLAVVNAKTAFQNADAAAAEAITAHGYGRMSRAKMEQAQDKAMRAAEALELAENALAAEEGRPAPYNR